MKQLSGSDNLFLISENKNVFNHVAMLGIYDVTTAPQGKVRFKDILKHFADRQYIDPLFRRRLVNTPFGIDRPYWLEDGDIDLEFHIRHIALPKPGDWRQLMIQVARIHSRPLDRSRPLWEAYVIEGLDNIPKLPPGAFAIFIKFHHASVDGMAGINLGARMHAETPDTATAVKLPMSVYVDRDPSAVEFATRALANSWNRVLTVGKLSAGLAGKLAGLGLEALENYGRGESAGFSGLAGSLPAPAPATRFNQPVSPNRVVDGFGMPISHIKRVRAKVPGASLNDIFLAVSGGAVRKYLQARNELPERSLVALMPMSLRSDGAGGGNSVGAASVKVRSDLDDPLERLRAAHREAHLSKLQAEKLGPDLFKNVMDNLPSALSNALLNTLFIPTINMTVSNVRGPDVPLYIAGAKAVCLYPVSIPTDGCGLNITGVSYNGVMWVSVVSCRSMLPDPAFFATCMKETWDELLAAADALPEAAIEAPAKPRRRAKAPVTQKAPVAEKAVASTKRPRSKKPAPAVTKPVSSRAAASQPEIPR